MGRWTAHRGAGTGAGGARRSGARGAGITERLEAVERRRRGSNAPCGSGKGIRQHAPRRPAEAVRRSQGATDKIERLGPKGVPDVPATARSEYAEVLGISTPDAGDRGRRQVFPATLEQLAQPPEAVTAAEAAREALLVESRRRASAPASCRPERGARPAAAQRRGLQTGPGARRVDSRTPTGYDPQRHDTVRAELTKLEPVALEAAKLASGRSGGDPGQGSRARRAGTVRARAAARSSPQPWRPNGSRRRVRGGARPARPRGAGVAGGGAGGGGDPRRADGG